MEQHLHPNAIGRRLRYVTALLPNIVEGTTTWPRLKGAAGQATSVHGLHAGCIRVLQNFNGTTGIFRPCSRTRRKRSAFRAEAVINKCAHDTLDDAINAESSRLWGTLVTIVARKDVPGCAGCRRELFTSTLLLPGLVLCFRFARHVGLTCLRSVINRLDRSIYTDMQSVRCTYHRYTATTAALGSALAGKKRFAVERTAE